MYALCIYVYEFLPYIEKKLKEEGRKKIEGKEG